MKLTLEHHNDPAIPYKINVEVIALTSTIGASHKIPVYTSSDGGKQTYNAEVCGFRVDAETPEAIVSSVEKLLPGLVNMARFPTYMFIARRSRRIYPVYTVGDEVLATTPNGPVFKHVELATVRERLYDFLQASKILGTPGKSDKLHVRAVRQSDLSLTRPLFYLKKRAVTPNDQEFWAPVLEAAEGRSIYTYAASSRREIDKDKGHEALRLRTQVAQALIADGRLNDELALRVDRLLPDYWQTVKTSIQQLLSKLVYNDVRCDMYQDGRYLIGVEYRQAEDRYSFYIGTGVEDLRARAAQDLMRRGVISSDDAVQVEIA